MKRHGGRRRVVEVELLERRRLLSGDAPVVTITERETAAGTILHVEGTAGDDRVRVFQLDHGIQVRVTGLPNQTFTGTFAKIVIDLGSGTDRGILAATVTVPAVIHGGDGADLLRGGAANDHLYAGANGGRDRLEGFGGDDVIVSIGNSTNDSHSGGDGIDSFWIDDALEETIADISADELASTSLHRVRKLEGWYGTRSTLRNRHTATLLDGQDLFDPAPTSSSYAYQAFSDRPLFSAAGPTAADVVRGAIDDRHFLATLAQLADADPRFIRESVVDLGDGTYAVRFFNGANAVYYRVDADLPVRSNGSLAYAGLGADGAIWAPIMEKAYAAHQSRRPQSEYRRIEGVRAHKPWQDLGYDGHGDEDDDGSDPAA